MLFNITVPLICTIYFYYIAFEIEKLKVGVIYYISETYLFAVANNVGFLKRFGGL
jgi:hypothetical protein